MSKAIIIGLLLALSILDTGCAEKLYITSTAPGSEIVVSNPLNDHDILSEGGGKNMESSYAHLSTNNTVYDVITMKPPKSKPDGITPSVIHALP